MKTSVVGTEEKNCKNLFCGEDTNIQWNVLVDILSSQVYDNQTGKYGRVPATHKRKADISDKGSRVLLCEMLTVSAVTRKPFCEIPSDDCSACRRQYLFCNHC